jgi:anaerobic magnesium-protoporphyrin IX monomethyl ester cyclase
MTFSLDAFRRRDPRFLLAYSALQFGPDEMAKPDGSLSLTYLAGALREAGYDVKILDVSVGDDDQPLSETFFNTRLLPSGLIRCGMDWERVAEKIADFDVVGVSSIFTTQTTMVLDLIRFVKQVDPTKLVVAGGVNARNLRRRFFDAGADIIVLTEGEEIIVGIADAIRGKRQLSTVPGIAFLDDSGAEVVNNAGPVIADLDKLPFPAWDLLPLNKYWEISRPHGGQFPEGKRIQYAALQTSRGCPFNCRYCHISKEVEGEVAGPIGAYRMKSVGRVLHELQILKDLGAQYIFFEDDSLFAKKKRAFSLFESVRELNLNLADVNGINIIHLLKNTGTTGHSESHLDIDTEFLEVLSAAGFDWLSLPFESANQRLLDKYSSSKWNISRLDAGKLIQECSRAGIKTSGNYMIGYPDESLPEIYNTATMARRHMDNGLNHATLFAVVPFPGTAIYDMVIQNGQLDPDFDTDQMKWTKSILKNLAVPAETLEHLRQLAWLTVNHSEFVHNRIVMRVKTPEPSPAAPETPALIAPPVIVPEAIPALVSSPVIH